MAAPPLSWIELPRTVVPRSQQGNPCDIGANLLQNFPAVTQVLPLMGGSLVSGTLSSTANGLFLIDVYGNPAPDASGYGEGSAHLGSAAVLTDGAGNATWQIFSPIPASFATATATDFIGDTSEFSGVFLAPQEASPAKDMKVERGAGTSLKVTYTPACGATDHAIYYGIGGPASLAPGGLSWSQAACGMGTSGVAIFDPGDPRPDMFFYFVIVGQNGAQEGSYGQGSNGVEEPEATLPVACDVPQSLIPGCS